MPMFKRSMAVLLVIFLLFFGVTVYGYHNDEGEVLSDADAVLEKSRESDLRQVAVYVTGEVSHPGVVYMGFYARVADAINECGGLLPTADMGKVNMAETVKDGMHIKVPEKMMQNTALVPSTPSGANTGMKAQSQAAATSLGDAGGLISINSADINQLTKIKGIGQAMAQRIVEYREANGGFQRIEDLQKVKGIGKAKYEKLKDQVTL